MDEYVLHLMPWAHRQIIQSEDDVADQLDEHLNALRRHPTRSTPFRNPLIFRDCQEYRFTLYLSPFLSTSAGILFHYHADEQTLLIHLFHMDGVSDFGVEESF